MKIENFLKNRHRFFVSMLLITLKRLIPDGNKADRRKKGWEEEDMEYWLQMLIPYGNEAEIRKKSGEGAGSYRG